ncbi:MAG: hypothetical protein MI757_17120 [Pirellulales bacterium]|nr:hypothetical protein [Pirellulales bacterium]
MKLFGVLYSITHAQLLTRQLVVPPAYTAHEWQLVGMRFLQTIARRAVDSRAPHLRTDHPKSSDARNRVVIAAKEVARKQYTVLRIR